jgi:hypothetical protein
MTNKLRKLCLELASELQGYIDYCPVKDDCCEEQALVNEARKEIEKLEYVVLTDESLERLKEVFCDSVTRPWHVHVLISRGPSLSMQITCNDMDQQDIDYLITGINPARQSDD